MLSVTRIRYEVGLALALPALAAAIGYALFAWDLADARARIAGRSATIEAPSGTIEYATAGQGRPVLVIHGAAGGFDQSLDMTGALAQHDHRLIAPSRFGYLGSAAKAELTVAGQAAAYVDLLDHLGVDKVAVIAISAGAWSALEFASRFPDRCGALVLLVPAAPLPPGTHNHGGAIARAMFESDFLTWAGLKATRLFPGLMDGMILGTDASVVATASASETARVNELLDHLLPMRPRAAGIAFDIKAAATSAPIAWNRISCPVLTVSAEDDLFGSAARAREISASVQHRTSVVYPTGGHALIGHYDEALREVTAFLSHHLPP
jgi:2-hydroxy-6-oxonona-2,4-dienedioate hydrolase